MKLTTTISKVARPGKFGRERNPTETVAAFFKTNPVIYTLGKLLAMSEDGGKTTLADRIGSGETIDLGTEIETVDGLAKLPLAEGYRTLSLRNCTTSWGCPACHSAHGTHIAPSPALDTSLMGENPFFYAVASKRIFTISATCWKQYFNAYASHFQEVPVSETPTPQVSETEGPTVETNQMTRAQRRAERSKVA